MWLLSDCGLGQHSSLQMTHGDKRDGTEDPIKVYPLLDASDGISRWVTTVLHNYFYIGKNLQSIFDDNKNPQQKHILLKSHALSFRSHDTSLKELFLFLHFLPICSASSTAFV